MNAFPLFAVRRHLIRLIVCWFALLGIRAVACEDEHPPVVLAPTVEYVLRDANLQPVVEMAFDPRGLRQVKVTSAIADSWVRESDTSGAWDYREWQWWKGQPWGDSCRPRYWTTADFSAADGDVNIHFRVDGFDCKQQFLLPKIVNRNSPHWDLVITVENISGKDVEEYGQFFACYTNFNKPKSCWFWEAGDRLTQFADHGVEHLDGYVSHPQAYFAERGAIPHCPRGGGKIVSKWHLPALVSHASPSGWRSVIFLEADHTAALAQGIRGAAMDYIIFPGPTTRVFENQTSFSVHVRHYLLKSPELPLTMTLEKLWSDFENSHETIHQQAIEKTSTETPQAEVSEFQGKSLEEPDHGKGRENKPNRVEIRSSADGATQPAMFFAPDTKQKVPLLVVLHTWSNDYTSSLHQACEDWCCEKGWVYIHPHFRGPNRNPEATGSELVVQDILDAVEFASRNASVDQHRIYLVGTSGGGYTALLMAGRKPEIWAGVSAWVPISDLTAWYHENKAMGDKHWREVADSCGGPPGTSKEVDRQYKLRSPLTYLKNAKTTALDINAGIHDGHTGSVPVSHSLLAFNAVSLKKDQFSVEEIESMVQEASIPKHLQRTIRDPVYGDKPPLLRRHSGRTRVTLFDGGHEYIPAAALNWLEQQRQTAAVKQP